VILPILDEFKPDLIINSAGQDNHYTDPITNMNFSAQGYAALNSRLKPDIAVLEGGYSIEGALPYVNVGIILAMAGLDFSKVKEPDYNPASIRQSRDITRYIEKVAVEIMDYWRRGPELRERNISSGKQFAERKRTVFYDTDNILEEQRERIRVCQDCPGVVSIESWTDRGRRAYAVQVPRKACQGCRDQGQMWYETASTRNFDRVLFQNRPKDEYLVKKA
jgi:hypothetical protein